MATPKKTSPRPAARRKTAKKPRLNAAERSAAVARLIKKEETANKTKADIKADTIAARPKLPHVLQISTKAVVLLWQHRWLFLGITVIYAVLNVLLVRGLSGSTDVSSIKQLVTGQYHGSAGQLIGNFAIFGALILSPNSSNSASSSDAGSVYQTILVLITSLAVVWALRQVMAGHKVRIRDAFYKGMYPLIPVILIVLLGLLELVPGAIGLTIFGEVVTLGIAVNWWQDVLWGIGCLAPVALSVYWLTTAVMAAYIVTVPDMTPVAALRSARKLVRYRRWAVIRKLLFLPAALLIVTAAIVLPIIFIWTPAAPWAVYALSMVGIAVIHAYIYTLYRELLA